MPDLAYLQDNPYLRGAGFEMTPEQKRAALLPMLANSLVSLGAGISSTAGTGQPWYGGVAKGAEAGIAANNADQARLFSQNYNIAQFNQQEAYRKAQEAHMTAQTNVLERNAKRADEAWNVAKDISANPPGMGYTPPPYQMGPGTPDQRGISANESSGQPNGGYGAIGPPANDKGNRGYGKYQMMDFNIGPWTQEVLGRPMTPQEFIAPGNEKAQDAVFNAKFGQLAKKYGPVGASRAWFAGEGGMNNPNATDVNGMTVQRYGDQFARNRGDAPVGPSGAGPTLASLPAFQGPGMGAMQPGALPPGAVPQVNMPPSFAPPVAPPGMAVGDGGPPSSPAAAPQVAQAAPAAPPAIMPAPAFDPGPMPQRDPRAKLLLMSPETKALGEAMDRQHEQDLNLWKWQQTEARSGRNEEMRLRQEADKLKVEGQKMVSFGPGQMYEPSTDTVHVVDPVMGNSSYKLHGGAPPAAPSDLGTPEPEAASAALNIPGRNEEYLKSLPPDAARMVKAYSDGRMPIPTRAALSNPTSLRLMSAVQQYDPSFDAGNYAARVNFRKSMTSGPIFQNIVGPSNKFLNHAASYLDAYDKLGMEDGLTSYVTNPLKLGQIKAARTGEDMAASTNLQGVKDEFAKFMGGKGQLTDLARKLESDLSISSSPSQTYATISKMKELMQGQLEPVAQQHRDLFRSPQTTPTDFIQPVGMKAIERIDRGPKAEGAPAAPAAAAARPAPPQPGFTKDGYRYKGGDPGQRMNWEPMR